MTHLRERARYEERDPKAAPIYGDMEHRLKKTLREGRTESPSCVWLFSREGKPIRRFKGDWEQACATAGVRHCCFMISVEPPSEI